MRVKVWVEHPYEGCPCVANSFLIPDAVFETMTSEQKKTHIEACAEDALNNLVYSVVGSCGWKIEEEYTIE